MRDSLLKAWNEKPLGDVCDVLDRLRKPIAKRDRVSGPYPYYGATGVLDYVADYIFDEQLVLIGEDGAKWGAGDKSAFSIAGKTWVNNHAHVLRPNRDVILDDWLIYYLNATDLSDFISGMTVPKLNQGRMREIPIPIPPLEEQRRIVAILHEAIEGLDRARENAEVNLQNARELFEANLRSAFTDHADSGKPATLGKTTKIVSGLVDPREEQYADLKHLGAGNMESVSDRLVEVKTAREEKLKSGKHLFDENMVLYSKIRPYLRKASRPNFSGLCSADVYPLLPEENRIDRDFLFYLLLSPQFTEYAEAGSARAGMPKVNRNHLFAYSFALPDLDTQKVLANKLDALKIRAFELETAYKEKLQDLDDLRQSFLQKALSGGLF